VINNKTVLAVVPARGGSKGVKLKNLRPIQGVPIVQLAGMVASQVPEIDRAVVSTDHDDIAAAAVAGGLADAFRRPESISGDRVSDVEVLTHAIEAMERIDGKRYDIVVMLQPTSPLRTADHVRKTIQKLANDDLDAVWTVSETDSKNHPLKQLILPHGLLTYYDPAGSKIIARQQLEPVYHRNGLAYAITRECLLDDQLLLGQRTGAVVCDGHFVSIDTEWDFDYVEFILSQRDRHLA
jgi:CMP-N,N'-diacetyllegionaminic acid synthase